jgi:hypothetical protein
MLQCVMAMKPANMSRSLELSCEIPADQLAHVTGGMASSEDPALRRKWEAEHPDLQKMTEQQREAEWRRADWWRSNQEWERIAPPFTKCVVTGVDARGLSIWNCTR